MWYYKLVVNNEDWFYYDYNDLKEARQDKEKYGGSIFDRNGKQIY